MHRGLIRRVGVRMASSGCLGVVVGVDFGTCYVAVYGADSAVSQTVSLRRDRERFECR